MKRTTAPNSVGGAFVDKVPGVTIGTTVAAEDMNNHQEEIANVVEGAGIVLSGANDAQLLSAIIALSHGVAEPVFSFVKRATSATWPAVRVDDADHDILAANYPDLVTALRAEKVESDGVTDFAGNIAGGVFTFPNNQAANRLLAALAEEQLVKGDYVNWLSLNLGGTDYVITNVNAGARTVTVAAPPGDGAYTGIIYPYRKAGAATTARLRRISARALMGTEQEAADTPDRMHIAGFRVRDRGQGHIHNESGAGGGGATQRNVVQGAIAPPDVFSQSYTAGPSTDGTNGTPRVGNATEPKHFPAYLYLWAARYIP